MGDFKIEKYQTKQFNVSSTAKIIDVGGGDSFLADNLLDMGYQDITVLDISEEALNRAKQCLGERAKKVKCITVDHKTSLKHNRNKPNL